MAHHDTRDRGRRPRDPVPHRPPPRRGRRAAVPGRDCASTSIPPTVIQRILGLLLMLFSVTMLLPVAVSLLYADGQFELFLDAFAIVLAAGLLAWLPARSSTARAAPARRLPAWSRCSGSCIGLAGAVPLLLADVPHMSFTDAVFEAVSGFTTTGATVLVRPRRPAAVDPLLPPRSCTGSAASASSCWPSPCCRCSASAACSCYRAETPGPMKDDQAHAAHHRDGQGAVAGLRAAHRGVRRGVLARRHDAVRRHRPLVLDGVHGRLLDARREHRVLREPGHRVDHHPAHDPRRGELRTALPRLAQPAPGRLLARPGVPRLPRGAGRDDVRYRRGARLERSAPPPVHLAALGAVPRRVGADQHGLHDGELRAVARCAARPADVHDLHRRLRGLDRRRHEGDPLAAGAAPGHARGHPADPSERRGRGQARRQAGRPAGRRGGVGILRRLPGASSRC